MIATFRVILLVSVGLSALGSIAGGKEDKKPCLFNRAVSGGLFLLSFAV